MDDKTKAHRLALIRAAHRRWKLRVAEERFEHAMAGADHYDEVDVLRRDVVSASAYGVEVLA